jgi:hypothetical protein
VVDNRPVTLFAAGVLSTPGRRTQDVTKAFGFVASTFSDLRSFDWETLELRATHAYGLENGH